MNPKTIRNIRKDFPVLKNKGLVYLDSAATSLKPFCVIKSLTGYYKNYSANVFRGLYEISERATQEYEKAREKIAELISAKTPKEIIFTRSATEAINLVAYSWGKENIKKGNAIVSTIMEHHSNFVPWQMLAKEKSADFKVIDIDSQGFLKLDIKKNKELFKKAKFFAVTHVSNVLGTINPLKEVIKEVKKINPKCLVLVDGAQAVPHLRVNVRELGCDFYVFSGHKMMGPTGIGVLWAKGEILEKVPPFNFGGEMVESVSLKKTSFKNPPLKFEAGTPHIAGAIGLKEAVNYLSRIGFKRIREHEIELTEYALSKLSSIENIEIYGPQKAKERGGVISFNIFTKRKKLIHPHDVAQILSSKNICLRAGHHCAMPLHRRLGVPASLRASFYIYNQKRDIDRLIKSLKEAEHILKITSYEKYLQKRHFRPL